jgi:hypothetical protein
MFTKIAVAFAVIAIGVTRKDSTMFTKVMMGIALALTAIPALPVTAAQAQYAVCLPARGCIPTTQKSYNACYELARERGWRDSDNDDGGNSRPLDRFIFLCLAGKIPR